MDGTGWIIVGLTIDFFGAMLIIWPHLIRRVRRIESGEAVAVIRRKDPDPTGTEIKTFNFTIAGVIALLIGFLLQILGNVMNVFENLG